MADLFCTTAMCARGRTSVNEMQNMYDTLSSDYTDFDRNRFAPTVSGIKKSFDDAYSVFSEYVPFNPTCCTIAELGKQADTVTSQMLQSVSAAPAGQGPSSAPPPIDIGGIGNTVLWVIGGILVLNVFQTFKR